MSFVDFGPTVLSLAGIEPDARLDGTPFLGRYAFERDDYRRGHAYANADRFDEVYDRTRSVSDGRYRYTRNILPDIPYLIRNAYREQLPMTAELYALVKNHIWPPDGQQPATPPAEIDDKAVLRGDAMAFVVALSCPDPGASIGYRLGTEKQYAGPWQVYTTPFEVPANRRFIEVRTHRIGHAPTTTGALLGRE